MLLVRTHLAPSPIHGIGVFADEHIPAGAEVWRFTAGLDLDKDPAEIAALPPHVREFWAHFGYLDRHLGRYVLCFDDARFINHADPPNTGRDCARDPHGVDVALVDIARGDEITIDYRELEGPSP